MSYVKINEVELVGNVGVNPIYHHAGTYYVGIESLCWTNEEVENCIETKSLEEAIVTCNEISGSTEPFKSKDSQELMFPILNGDGEYCLVSAKLDSEGSYVLEKPDEHYCLTCGKFFKADDKIQLTQVFSVEGLNEWLNKRKHNTNLSSNIIICPCCLEEFYEN